MASVKCALTASLPRFDDSDSLTKLSKSNADVCFVKEHDEVVALAHHITLHFNICLLDSGVRLPNGHVLKYCLLHDPEQQD